VTARAKGLLLAFGFSAADWAVLLWGLIA